MRLHRIWAILLYLGYNACKSAPSTEDYPQEYPRWIGDTAYQLKVDGVSLLGKNRQVSDDKACADALRSADRKFSEQIVGADITRSCPAGGCEDKVNDWKYRLSPDVFVFKAKEISRKIKVDGKYVVCWVIAEYADANLRQKTDAYIKEIRRGD